METTVGATSLFGAPAATPGATAPLLPRFRRRLSLGGIVDDTIVVYRGQWRRYIGLNVVSLAAGLAVLVVFGGAALVVGGLTVAGALLTASRRGGDLPDSIAGAIESQAVGAILGIALVGVVALAVSGLLGSAWYGAAVMLTDGALRGERRPVGDCLLAGLRRSPAVLGAGALYVLALLAVAVLGVLPYPFLRGWAALLVLAGLIGLLVWAVARDLRVAWLKWLIVIAIPFGLPIYFYTRWSLFIPAAVLERAGPLSALGRSAELIDQRWFRVLGISVLVGLIISMLQAIPGTVVSFATPGQLFTRQDEVNPVYLVISFVTSMASSTIGSLLFSSLEPIARTLTFVALRNEREGADIAERLAALEPAPAL